MSLKDELVQKECIIEQLKKELISAKLDINKFRQNEMANTFDLGEKESSKLTGNSAVLKKPNSGNTSTVNIHNSDSKNLLTLNLTKKLIQNNEYNEVFSDRIAKNFTPPSLIKNFSSSKKENILNINNNNNNSMASLFRQSNKITINNYKLNDSASKYYYNLENPSLKNNIVFKSHINLNNQTGTNNSNISIPSISNNRNLTSPFKNKIASYHKHTNSKPLEEILKNTAKLMEEKIDDNVENEKDREYYRDKLKIISNIQEINDQFKNVKSRTHKLLNMYSDLAFKKTKTNISQLNSNTFTSMNTHSNSNC